MRKFFNWFSSAFAILFAIPSFFILISWNALPGETLYAVKTGLEDMALAVTIRTPVASAFSINFTQRRFSEANRLLAKKGSTVGYTLLVAEARETQTIIVDQKDTQTAQLVSPTPGPAVQAPTPAPSAEAVIEDLETANQELEEIKEEIKKQLPPQASERARENREEHERNNPRQD